MNQPQIEGILESEFPKSTFIYLLSDPRNNKPFYVGKSTCVISRVGQHLYTKHTNPRLAVILDDLKYHLLFPKIEILETVSGDGSVEEKRWMVHYVQLYPDLCNRVANKHRK